MQLRGKVGAGLAVSEAREDTRVGLIGKTIGRYQVTAELGRGGMATVYRAHDPQLGRDVAIKVMHGAFAGRDDLEARFRREARAVASIKHDGIVNVFDFAPASAGEPGYIVTEIVEGPTLRTVVDGHGGRLLPELATLVAARIAGALGAAHARGIVHRDVKPDNVMFDLSGGTVRVLLTDFGIAHITEIDSMTVTGAIVGSPIYMSPEQTRGQEVGPASDVFSLGVLLYQIITGRPPFVGRDPMTAIAAIQRGEFLRPSQVDAHVGPALEAVILRCLQRLPAMRFPDGSAVEAALAELARQVQKTLDLNDGAEVLRRFFDDTPPGFVAGLSERVAAQALEQARGHARRRELARALAETNRVFAYAPGHAGAQALLDGIAQRRRMGRLAAAGLVVAAVVGMGLGVQRWSAARRAAGAAKAVVVGANGGAFLAAPVSGAKGGVALGGGSVRAPVARELPLAPRGAPARELPLAQTTQNPRESASPARALHPTAKDRPPAAGVSAMASGRVTPAHAGSGAAIRAPSRNSPGAATASTTAASPATASPAAAMATSATASAPAAIAALSAGESALPPGAPPATGSIAPVAPTPPGPATHPPVTPTPATASLALRASQGFCSPSMDDQPASIHPFYDRVSPGRHHLYCTLPGRSRSFVADYDLRAGARPNLVIVPGADGTPVLSRPE